MRRRVREAAKAILLALTLTAVWAQPAGAQSINQWFLTSHGSAHVLMTGNHLIIQPFDAYGNTYGHVVNQWLPAHDYCQLQDIRPGNAAGQPLQLLFYSHHAACIPSGGGWWDGGSQVQGTIYATWPAEHTAIYFPRRGTAVTVW